MLSEEEIDIIKKLSKIDSISNHLKKLFSDAEGKLVELRQYEIDISKNHQAKENQFHEKTEADESRLRKEREAINKIISEKTKGFPWLADAIAQYTEFRDLKLVDYLKNKSHPAVASAYIVRQVAGEKRELQRKFIITRNFIRYYEALFPWLREFATEDIDDLLIQVTQNDKEDEDTDPVKPYLTDGEYETLSQTERNQRALDRYWKKQRTSWQLGRDYERYIGYLYEQKGFSVYYQGIEKGFEDLGRDLICKNGNQVEIVQCKYWREGRTIHEKHINQLFGTTVEYFIKNINHMTNPQLNFFPSLLKQGEISATFYTSAHLSDTARDFASALGVKINEGFSFKRYPSIKCNISRQDGLKIYHLPFDQQYDRTTIEEERGECYVETVEEAEQLGFRRAWRWRGKND